MKFLPLLIVILFANEASARVFNFSRERFAGYVRGTYGTPSAVKDTPFGSSSGSSTAFSDEIGANFGGEIGFIFGITENLRLRAGFEAVRARNSELVGKNASGTTLMDLSSSSLALGPSATIELILGEGDSSRWMVFAGTTWAEIQVDNEYEVTSDGDTAYGGAVGGAYSYNEQLDATEIGFHLGAAYEKLLVDNVTFMLEAGYRDMNFDKLKYSNRVNNAIRGTAQTTLVDGETAKNDDGSDRSIDLGGIFVGLSLRFYIQLN